MIEKLKNKFQELVKNGMSVILILFGLQLLLNFFIIPNIYHNNVFDDIWFMRQVEGTSIIDFATSRYHDWGSRVIIETTLCVLLKLIRHSKFIWIILNTCAITLVRILNIKIICKRKQKRNEQNGVVFNSAISIT